MEAMGWIGSFLLAVCGFPQAVKSFREKNSDGLSWGFLLCWLFGEIFALIYTINLGLMPLILNYIINLASLLVIIYYKITPEKSESITNQQFGGVTSVTSGIIRLSGKSSLSINERIALDNHEPNSHFTADDLRSAVEKIRKERGENT